MSQELKDLKGFLKTKLKSQAQVSIELGYRSAMTINHWLRDGDVPNQAKQKVREYLEKMNYGTSRPRR